MIFQVCGWGFFVVGFLGYFLVFLTGFLLKTEVMQLCFPVSVSPLSHPALISNAGPCQPTSVKFHRGNLGSKI